MKKNMRSVPGVRDLLRHNWDTCENCSFEKDFRTVAQQFQMRKPQWWVVNGKSVIPVWIIERLRTMRYET